MDASQPRLLLDLSLWYAWHRERGSLPERWKGMDLGGICADLGIVIWNVQPAYRTMYGHGAREEIIVDEDRKIRRWETASGSIEGRWIRGPDGDWWQSEYPIKSVEDIPIALEAARARTYVLEDFRRDAASASVRTTSAINALELPMHPYSEVLHSFLGWTEGFYIQSDAPEEVAALVAILEEKRLDLATRLAARLAAGATSASAAIAASAVKPGNVSCFLSPDNLDGRFIPADTFARELAPDYAALGKIARAAGAPLVVHAGGTLAALLPLLAEAGVDWDEGVAPAPQGDTTLAEARKLAGPEMVLWGGLPQDFLVPSSPQADFEAALRETAAQVCSDGKLIAGIADRVPPEAAEERLLAVVAEFR